MSVSCCASRGGGVQARGCQRSRLASLGAPAWAQLGKGSDIFSFSHTLSCAPPLLGRAGDGHWVAEMTPGPVLWEAPSPAGEADVSSDSGSPLHSPIPALEKIRLNRGSKTSTFALAGGGPYPASSFNLFLYSFSSSNNNNGSNNNSSYLPCSEDPLGTMDCSKCIAHVISFGCLDIPGRWRLSLPSVCR